MLKLKRCLRKLEQREETMVSEREELMKREGRLKYEQMDLDGEQYILLSSLQFLFLLKWSNLQFFKVPGIAFFVEGSKMGNWILQTVVLGLF